MTENSLISHSLSKTRTVSTSEIILQTSEQVFAAKGYSGASLDEIAQLVGIRRPSLLHHYRSKRELYDAVERGIFEDLVRFTISTQQGASHFDRLMSLLHGWLSFMVARPAAARIILRNTSDLASRAGNADPVEFSEMAISIFENIIRDGIASSEFEDINPAIPLNILAGSIVQYVCNASQFGASRVYQPEEKAVFDAFFTSLERAAKAVLLKA